MTNDLNLPSGGMHGYNGIYWGFAPDDAAGTKMSDINGNTGKQASTYVDRKVCFLFEETSS